MPKSSASLGDKGMFTTSNGAIFVWPRNENARTKQKQQTNGKIWLVYRTDTNARGFWLVERTLGWKNFTPQKFLEINRYFALTSYCGVISQSKMPFHVRVFFGGKTKRPCFDLFIHWLMKQIRNTYRNHFSRSYENRSILQITGVVLGVVFLLFLLCVFESVRNGDIFWMDNIISY